MVAGADQDDPWAEMARLALRLAHEHEPRAFSELWDRLAPEVERWLRQPGFLGRVADDEDHRREIVVRAWEQLQDRDHAKLRAFAERGEGGDLGPRFRAFTHRVVKNLGIDYLRTLPEFIRHRAEHAPTVAPSSSAPHWRSIVSLTSSAAGVPYDDDAEGLAAARRMLEFLDESIAPARRRAAELADRGLDARAIARELGLPGAREAARAVERARERRLYRPAIELWSQGHDAEEIAAALGLPDGDAAERVLGAAKELLRRHFRTS
jgi:hypothetical protein